MRKVNVIAAAFIALAWCAGSTWATPIINVGNIVLSPNTAGQVRQILVSGPDAVQGLNFRLQVEDGGTGAGGSINGPKITAVDIIGPGTIFNSSNTGSVDPGSAPQFAERRTSTNLAVSPTVAASGVLANVTFDTTGFSGGIFALSLKGTVDGDTNFGASTPATITNGTLQVPEPASLGLILVGTASLLRRKRRAA